MELPIQLFEELTGTAVAEAPGQPPDERRKHPRVAMGARARILPLLEGVGGGGSPVLVRDISLAGIGFLSAAEMNVGDEFVIHLPAPSGRTAQIQSIVNRCERGGTGCTQYVVGATFELVLDVSATPVESEKAVKAAVILQAVENLDDAPLPEATAAAQKSIDSHEAWVAEVTKNLSTRRKLAHRVVRGARVFKPFAVACKAMSNGVVWLARTMSRIVTMPFVGAWDVLCGLFRPKSRSSARIRNRLRPAKPAKGTKSVPHAVPQTAPQPASHGLAMFATRPAPVPVAVGKSSLFTTAAVPAVAPKITQPPSSVVKAPAVPEAPPTVPAIATEVATPPPVQEIMEVIAPEVADLPPAAPIDLPIAALEEVIPPQPAVEVVQPRQESPSLVEEPILREGADFAGTAEPAGNGFNGLARRGET